VATSDLEKKINELRAALMDDVSPGQLMHLQLKVDTLMRLAMMDAGHDHDTQGGVGHHDHTALADLSWQLERPSQILDIQK